MPTVLKSGPDANLDIQATIAEQLFLACRSHLKGNDIPKNVAKRWFDHQTWRPGRQHELKTRERCITRTVIAGRRELSVQVFQDAVFLDYRAGQKSVNQGFDLTHESFERDIAEFLGKHFDCYFPTYWMTRGLD